MKNLFVKQNEEGKKLFKYIRGFLVETTDGFVYKMLRKKNILLNDKKATGNEILKYGDKISIFFKDETIDKLTKKSDDKYDDIYSISTKDLEIVFEDENLIIVDKKVGQLSQKSKESDVSINEICLKHMIDNNELDKEDFKTYKPSVVNRLDRNTIGLMIFAKNYKTFVDLTEKIKTKKIEKFYLALVNGIIKEDKKYIEAYLVKDKINNKSFIYESMDFLKNKDYEIIKTEYEVLERRKDVTLIKIKLLTGKSHQIRALFSHLGYPLVGDKKYMIDDLYKKNVEKYNAKYQKLISYELHIDDKIFFSRYKI